MEGVKNHILNGIPVNCSDCGLEKVSAEQIKIIVHGSIANFISSFVSRKHALKGDLSLFRKNEVSHWVVYNKVKVVLISQNKTLFKKACFEKFYRPKIQQKLA